MKRFNDSRQFNNVLKFYVRNGKLELLRNEVKFEFLKNRIWSDNVREISFEIANRLNDFYMRDLLAIGATSKLVFPRIEVFNTWDERTKTYNFSFVVDE